MRIVELNKHYPPFLGGVEDHVRQCCLELSADHDVHALVCNTAAETVKDTVDGVPVTRVASFGKVASQPLAPMLPYHLARLKPDLVHLHAPNPLGILSYLLALPRTPLVITHHGDITQQKYLKHLVLPFYQRVLQKACAVVLFTERYGRTSAELQDVQDKIFVIPHGTEAALFERTSRVAEEATRLRHQIAGGAPTVTFIGRIVEWKGVHVLLRALAELPGVHAFIGGDGDALEKNEARARKMGLGERVHFMGRLNDEEKVPVFHAGDVFVLPTLSRSESFGIVQVEAQLCERPVVVSSIGGAPEVTKDGQTGALVPPGDPEALADTLHGLLEHDARRERLGRAGRRRAEAKYVRSVTAPRLRRLFRSLERKLAG